MITISFGLFGPLDTFRIVHASTDPFGSRAQLAEDTVNQGVLTRQSTKNGPTCPSVPQPSSRRRRMRMLDPLVLDAGLTIFNESIIGGVSLSLLVAGSQMNGPPFAARPKRLVSAQA